MNMEMTLIITIHGKNLCYSPVDIKSHEDILDTYVTDMGFGSTR